MSKEVRGYYSPYSPQHWIGDLPESFETRRYGQQVPPDWQDRVVDKHLDVGIRVVAERWGLVVFDFTEWALADDHRDEDGDGSENFDMRVARAATHIKVMNAHLTLIHSVSIELHRVGLAGVRLSPRDVIAMDDVTPHSMSGPGLTRIPETIGIEEMVRGQAIPLDVFERSLDLLNQVLVQDPEAENAVEHLNLLNQAHAGYHEHDYALAVVGGWTICERLLNRLWRQYLDDQSRGVTLPDGRSVKTVNSKRRERLVRDFTASIVSEVLELAGALPHTHFRRLNEVRQARNAWLHSASKPDAQVAGDALLLASELLSDETAIPVRVGLARGTHL